MTTNTPVQVGQLIERLGQARDLGQTSTADAIAQLQAADPNLSAFGAHAQLRAWRGAAARYAHQHAGPDAGRVDARSLVARTPFTIRAYRGGAA